jgi:hypothetical protein
MRDHRKPAWFTWRTVIVSCCSRNAAEQTLNSAAYNSKHLSLLVVLKGCGCLIDLGKACLFQAAERYRFCAGLEPRLMRKIAQETLS